MQKYKGFVSQITNPADLHIGNCARLWFNSQYLTPPDERFGQITLENGTWQNFPHPVRGLAKGDMKGYLNIMRNSGKAIIACASNSFNKRYNTPLKSLPKDHPDMDKANPENYQVFRDILREITKIGVDFIQVGNEWNKYPGKPTAAESLTGLEYGQLLTQFVKDIREINPVQKIITCPTAKFDEDWLNEFIGYWKATNSFDNIYISLNVYDFGGCGYGRLCNVIKPEDSDLYERVNAFMVKWNVQAFITEYGCNSEKKHDLAYPDYPGLDKYQSQAKFIIDSTNKWLAQSNIIGATVYQLDDDPGEPRFEHTGLCFHSPDDPKPKPSYAIVKAAFESETPPTPPPSTKREIYYTPLNSVTQDDPELPTLIQPGEYYFYTDGEPPIEYELKINGETKAKGTEGIKPLVIGGDDNGAFRKRYTFNPGDQCSLTINGDIFEFSVASPQPEPEPKKKVMVTVSEGKLIFEYDPKEVEFIYLR